MNLLIRLRHSILLLALTALTACSSSTPTVTFTATSVTIASSQSKTWTFDAGPAGSLPAGATAFTGNWAVSAESDAPSAPNALCQTGNATFPALALSDDVYGDVMVSVRFKPISGQSDQAAGIIFRVQDKDNYYILRANALENNINLYTCIGGQRRVIKEGTATVVFGQWQTLKVGAVGNTLRGYLNDQWVVETKDDTFTAGRVGLWTKADSVTCFDDVQAIAL